jgi:sugar transferase (PEP-CTERM/EpsH1 system associated)
MRDLLFLTQRIPYPPNKGDKIRSWHILEHLAQRYRIHLGCFLDDPYDRQYERKLAAICASVHCEQLTPALARLRSLTALLRGEPMTLAYFGSVRLRRWVDEIVRRYPIERVFVFCSAMAPYAANVKCAARVLDMVDVDSQKWLQYAQGAKFPARWIYAREARSLLRLEREAAVRFDRTLLVSEAEAALFRRLAPECGERVLAMPNGVDSELFSPDRDYPNPFAKRETAIVFTGAMDYRPNIEAVQWFADSILPTLTARSEGVTFWIVGANPASAVQRLAKRSGIRVTGRVEDVRAYLAHAGAVVAPLLIARGIQNKVLEAMAMAKPVIATPQACEGIDARDGQEVLVAHDAASFSAQLRIALGPGGEIIGQQARRRVQAQYDWAASLRTIDRLLERDLPGHAPSPAALVMGGTEQ